MPRLGGIFAAILTPLRANNRPDIPRFLDRCAALLDDGCDGLNVLGTTGEANSIALADRIALIEAIGASRLPRARLMVGTGTPSLADTIRLTSLAVDAGFAGALVLPPFYYKSVDDDGLFHYFTTLMERVDEPRLRLYLYNFPQQSGLRFSPALVKRLVDFYPQTVAGIKDSSGDLDYCAELHRLVPDLAIFPSSEGHLLEARRLGLAGCISASVNLTSALAQRVWSNPDAPAAQADQDRLAAMRAAIASVPLIPAIRTLTAMLTDDFEWERILPPLMKLTMSQRSALIAALEPTGFFAAGPSGRASSLQQ